MEATGDLSEKIALFTGEIVDDLGPKQVSPLTDAELNQRYVKEGVRIVTEQARYPLNQILSMFSDTFETESGDIQAKYKRDPNISAGIDGIMVENRD